jgi:hypothetical protein
MSDDLVEPLNISNDLDEVYSNLDMKLENINNDNIVEPLNITNELEEVYSNYEEKINILEENKNKEFDNLTNEEKNIKNDLDYAIFAEDSFKPANKRKSIDNYKYLKEYSNRFIASYVDNNKKELVISFKGTDFKEIWEQISQFNPLITKERFKEIDDKYKIYNENSVLTEPIRQLLMDFEIGLGSLDTSSLGTIGSFITGLSGTEIFTQRIIDSLDQKYPNYNKIFTGFSLGGALSRRQYMSNKENSRAITFNGATGITPILDETIKCMGNDCNIKNYRIKNDLVSRTGLTQGDIITLNPKENVLEEFKDSYFPSHKINHFINRKNFKETSEFEMGDNPIMNLIGVSSSSIGQNIITKSPQILMGLLNSIKDIATNKIKFIPVVGIEKIKSRRKIIGEFNIPPQIGKPMSETRRIRKIFYPDEL